MKRTRDAYYSDEEAKTHVIIDYTQEKFEDEVLKDIKKFCLSYLDDETIIADMQADELIEMREFLKTKYSEAMEIKESMQLRNYSWPFTSIAQAMDSIMMEQSLDSVSSEMSKHVLARELNYLLESLAFCYGILDNAIEHYYREF